MPDQKYRSVRLLPRRKFIVAYTDSDGKPQIRRVEASSRGEAAKIVAKDNPFGPVDANKHSMHVDGKRTILVFRNGYWERRGKFSVRLDTEKRSKLVKAGSEVQAAAAYAVSKFPPHTQRDTSRTTTEVVYVDGSRYHVTVTSSYRGAILEVRADRVCQPESK